MTAKETKEAKRLVRMLAFAKGQVEAHFTHVPPTPVDLKHAATIATMEGLVEDLGGHEAIQKSGLFGEKTEEQRADRGDVESMLRKINTSAAAIATERQNPALMDRFRMPHDDSDRNLASKLTSFATAIEELNLVPALAEHALVVTVEGLKQMAADLIGGTGQQGQARAAQVGATASIPVTLKAARGCKKTLEAIYMNVFEKDAGTLAAWKSASHVERDGGPGNDETPPTPEAPK